MVRKDRSSSYGGLRRAPTAPNAFEKGFRSIPNPTPDSFVFPWNSIKKDYLLTSFDPEKAKGKLNLQDVEKVLQRLKKELSTYVIASDNRNVFFFICILGLLLGIVAAILLAILQLSYYSAAGFFAVWLFFCIIGFISNVIWNRKIVQRGREIKKVFEKVNLETEPKGVKWSSGTYGSYLKVSFGEVKPVVVGHGFSYMA